jgi:hypothetical protein
VVGGTIDFDCIAAGDEIAVGLIGVADVGGLFADGDGDAILDCCGVELTGDLTATDGAVPLGTVTVTAFVIVATGVEFDCAEGSFDVVVAGELVENEFDGEMIVDGFTGVESDVDFVVDEMACVVEGGVSFEVTAVVVDDVALAEGVVVVIDVSAAGLTSDFVGTVAGGEFVATTFTLVLVVLDVPSLEVGIAVVGAEIFVPDGMLSIAAFEVGVAISL